MATITEALQESVTQYHDLMAQSDPRVEHALLMKSPWPVLAISLLYFYLVLSALPRFMQSRQPLQLKQGMIIYNFTMVILSGFVFLQLSIGGWLTGYRFIGCEPVDYSNSPKALSMVLGGIWFVNNKVFELLDTVIFVLRKKNSQVTFLHVFHHGALPCFFWCGVKFAPGGFGSFIAWVNSFVHFVMYFYYGVSALGPKYHKYLWWKRYLTSLQLVQFVTVVLHATQVFFLDCGYPRTLVYFVLFFCTFFFILFMDFFIKAYIKSPSKKKAVSNGTATTVTNGSLNGNANVPMATNGTICMETNGIMDNSNHHNGDTKKKWD